MGTSFCVRVKTRWRLSMRTLEKAESGYSSSSAPQLAPALLTSTFRSVVVPRQLHGLR